MDEEGCTMTEIRAIARLPTLDIEFVRRELPDEGAEQIAVRMTARPSFEPFGAALRQALPAIMAMNPALFWFDVGRQATKSWLRLTSLLGEDRRVSRQSDS
jgi:hypothetical protein